MKETGAGTPIFGEIDEGIAGADNTGVKNSTATNSGFFLLTDSPSDMSDGSGITAVSLKMRAKQSGRVDDTSVFLQMWITKANETTQVGGSTGVSGLDLTTQTTYANSGNIDIYTGLASQWTALTKTELDGLRVTFRGARTVSMSADSITWFLDAVELIVTYTPSASTYTKAGYGKENG